MRRSGIAQEQMRKTAQTFSRCSALASARARRLAVHRRGDDDAVVASACLRMLLTGTSRTRDRMRRACCCRRVRCRVRVSPRPTRSTARARHDEHTRPDERDAAGRSAASAAAIADAAPATPDCDAHHRHCQKTGATFAASRHRCSGAAFQHVATESCASMRAARPASAAWRGASGACVASARCYSGHSEMPIARLANLADCRQRAPLPAAAFVCAAQTKTGRTRRPVRLSRRGARLSGRLPRAARRSRPASAGRSTAPDRRSPARRSSLRRRRPR